MRQVAIDQLWCEARLHRRVVRSVRLVVLGEARSGMRRQNVYKVVICTLFVLDPLFYFQRTRVPQMKRSKWSGLNIRMVIVGILVRISTVVDDGSIRPFLGNARFQSAPVNFHRYVSRETAGCP